MKLALVGVAVLLLFLLAPARAEACGCFTPPDPTVPVVQAGERILFSVENGVVTAHVQVQYAGGGSEFGWLLPVPAVPTLELGSDELFTRLTLSTQPRYRVTTSYGAHCPLPPVNGGFGGGAATSGGPVDAGIGGVSPLVVQDSVGPYDYAVLRADSKDAMLAWLAANRYFVPAGTDASLTPYLQPGSYFLALKLRTGSTTGDLQPIVMHYASDLGVIPLTLTSTGATPNMGVQVFMLGTGRAIPRNYAHTVLNDARIDWSTNGGNYNDVIIAAVSEAEGRHSFITEYAGPGAAIGQSLAPSGRFGDRAELAAQPDVRSYLTYLFTHGFLAPTTSGMPALPTPLKATLTRYVPLPTGVTAEVFYANYDQYSATAPTPNFQPVVMTDEIWERVVLPLQTASTLFTRLPTLTRLYSTISPADMNRDPAFSFNPSLPAVSNIHTADLHIECDTAFRQTSWVLTTEQGWKLASPDGTVPTAKTSLPASLRIEALGEEGAPTVLVDNTVVMTPMTMDPTPTPNPIAGCTCASVPSAVLWVALGALGLRRRRAPR
jgi:Uncharacterized protein conserved in bacteria (DUF2330)